MILSHAKIEEIAAAVIKDFNLFFFGEKASEARSMPQGTPIDQFASEYLRLKISFEKLSVDGSLCGLTAYEDTEYAIEENGVSRTIPLKRNQVLLDSSFIAPGDVRKLCGKRRFTLAHECAHQLLFHLESEDILLVKQHLDSAANLANRPFASVQSRDSRNQNVGVVLNIIQVVAKTVYNRIAIPDMINDFYEYGSVRHAPTIFICLSP